MREGARLGTVHAGFNLLGGQVDRLHVCTEAEWPVTAHGRQRTRGLIDGTIDEWLGLNGQQSGTSGSENDGGRNPCQPTAH
jgi:hypothetical protein